MKLKEFNIKELKMNGMKVGFEKGKVTIDREYIDLHGVALGMTEWTVIIDFIETNLEYIYKFKKVIDVEMITDKGDVLEGKVVVSAIEEKVLTELRGVDKLKGYEVQG